MQVARVREVVHGLPAITESLLLRQLVVVVGKLQIDPPAVDIDRSTMSYGMFNHSRTFNVPAGPPSTPRTLPGRLARFGRFPEREVAVVPLGKGSRS